MAAQGPAAKKEPLLSANKSKVAHDGGTEQLRWCPAGDCGVTHPEGAC